MKNKTETNLKEWKVKEIERICNFFVKKKFCAEFNNSLEQYQEFLKQVNYLNDRKEYLIRDMVTKSTGLRRYLQIHSVIPPYNEEDDWFVKVMRDILRITDEDIESVKKSEFVPQDILDKLQIFDPEPAGLEKECIRIEYDFWGFGGPIRIIDTVWEGINKESVDVKGFLSQYDHINPGTKPLPVKPDVKLPSSYTREELRKLDEEDGIPF